MSLRPTHRGYAYQDLLTGIALVDLMIGAAESVVVDTKGFVADRFDDLTIVYRGGRRARLQIKHTSLDRELSEESFTGDGRSLRVDRLFDAVLEDLAQHPETEYRVVVRDGDPDADLRAVLRLVGSDEDPGDPLPGVLTRRYRFDPIALREGRSWQSLLERFADAHLREACEHLTIDTGAPAATLDFAEPGPAERALLRRVIEDLGAGRSPNAHILADHAALSLAHAATSARALDGNVTRESLLPRIGLTTDFGAVIEGHPVEPTVAVARAGASDEVRTRIDSVVGVGGRVVLVGGPGVGKSWLCEQLAGSYRDADWVVARHHCWLGSIDIDRDDRVLTEVVVGSLLRQLEEAVSGAVRDLRPRFAATPEAVGAAVEGCLRIEPGRRVLLLVDGLDHVDRVQGRQTGQLLDPSRQLVDRLAEIALPPGACMLIASQPGRHLDGVASTAGAVVELPPMSWDEMATLAARHGVLDWLAPEQRFEDSDDGRAIVDLIHGRSRGNALYGTYLCRYATRTSPLDPSDQGPVTSKQLLRRLQLVPESASDLNAYYDHLLNGLSGDQLLAVGVLALCDFAVAADELGEIFPILAPLLPPALTLLAPVLTSTPSVGGLRLHHESFGRHILRDRDEAWTATVRQNVAEWLSARGFLADARAFRHLPELLARLDRYEELKSLVQPGFVADCIHAFQPPEALVRVVGVVAREAQARLDWPTLILCVETRKSIDTYESEALADSIVTHSDVIISTVGAAKVAERLMHEGRPTFPPRWGLRLCEAVDRAGAAAPWKFYIDAYEVQRQREHITYSSDNDGTLQRAIQLGSLRVRAQHDGVPPDFHVAVAEHLMLDHEASLEDLVEVFAACLPAESMLAVAASMSDPHRAARVYLALADLAESGLPGLPDHSELARRAWTRDPSVDIGALLDHSIPVAEVLDRLASQDLERDLHAVTTALLGERVVHTSTLRNWLSLLRLGHLVDRTIPARLLPQLNGVGFYRAWLRFAVATVGIDSDVAEGLTSDIAASTAVRLALADLASEAHPFTGDPRACDLYSIHPTIHEVIERSLVVVLPADLDAVLDHLIAIGDGTTTTTNFGLPENGPLTTNDLLELLARASRYLGVDAVHSMIKVIRVRRRDTHTQYAVTAEFELATARICAAAGANDDADDCWRSACLLLASYGGHKDPTISEIVDSVHDIADVDLGLARTCLGRLLDLVYLVWQHTDGRGTSHFVNRWWEVAADVDPTAAALDGADLQLASPGMEDVRAYTAHTRLLERQAVTADPIVLAALRITVGTSWRRPTTDVDILARLEGELGKSVEGDAMLAVIANSIAASYDEQPMMYASDQPDSVATSSVVDAIARLGGSSFLPQIPLYKKDQNWRNPDYRSSDRPTPLEQLVGFQRPVVPPGRTGAIVAARDFDAQRYRDEPAPRWDPDAVANAIGWRVLEITSSHGADAGIALIDDVAREIASYSDNELFAVLGEGLAARASGNEPLTAVASYCLTVAFVRLRGGGGWQTFAGRERVSLWADAHHLDPGLAERTLAAAIVERVVSGAQGTYGITQAVTAAFAVSDPGSAVDCWEAAFPVIQHRLPGESERSGHEYRPTTVPDARDALDVAMAILAVATISRPMRVDLRRALVAAAVLLTLRPAIAQAALAHVLGSRLDAGRATWLLEVAHAVLSAGDLTDGLAEVLEQLAAAECLSTRALAAEILEAHGRLVPELPVTEASPTVRAALRRSILDVE